MEVKASSSFLFPFIIAHPQFQGPLNIHAVAYCLKVTGVHSELKLEIILHSNTMKLNALHSLLKMIFFKCIFIFMLP